MNWTAHLKYLQVVLKKFNSVVTLNKDGLIQYFWNCLCPYIKAQLDQLGKDLDMYNKAIEKIINIEIKAS